MSGTNEWKLDRQTTLTVTESADLTMAAGAWDWSQLDEVLALVDVSEYSV